PLAASAGGLCCLHGSGCAAEKSHPAARTPEYLAPDYRHPAVPMLPNGQGFVIRSRAVSVLARLPPAILCDSPTVGQQRTISLDNSHAPLPWPPQWADSSNSAPCSVIQAAHWSGVPVKRGWAAPE